MIPFALYVLKVILCSALLTGYYYMALRNRIFHQWNRFYLLISMVLSLTLPLCTLTYFYSSNEPADAIRILQAVSTSTDFSIPVQGEPTSFSMQEAATYGYILVCTLLFFSLLISTFKLLAIIRRHRLQQLQQIWFLNTTEKGTPFSFFNYLFWNRTIDIHSTAGQQIFRHELTHIRERHTWDKLFMQLVLVLFWLNPFFWIIRHELRMIHEFIADKKSVNQQDATELATMILQTTYPTYYTQLTNPFFQRTIKRRLLMLTKLQNTKVNYLSRVLALPLMVLVVAAFTLKPVEKAPFVALEKKYIVVIDAGHGQVNGKYDGAVSSTGIYEDNLTWAIVKELQAANSNPNLQIILTRSGNDNVPLNQRLAIVKDNNADLFISIHVDAHRNAKLNGASIIVPNNKPLGSLLLASAISQSISSHIKTLDTLRTRQAGVFLLNQNPAPASVLIECGYLTNAQDLAFITKKENQRTLAKSILKGIENYLSASENKSGSVFKASDTIPARKIRTEDIAEMNVVSDKRIELKLKDGTTHVYTLAELKKEGLINDNYSVTTQSLANEKRAEQVIISGSVSLKETDTTKRPLVVINGEVYPFDALNAVDPNTIQSVDVLKDASAKALWGEKGTNGVIHVKLKEGVTPPSKKGPFQKKDNVTVNFESDSVSVSAKGDMTIHNPVIETRQEPIFTQTEVPPQFPGGAGAWRKYLEKNLNGSIGKKNKAPKGTYTVIAQFLVEKDGSLSDVKALTQHGYGLEAEVVRVMKAGPKWVPAIQNGKLVRAYHKQPVTFVITDDKDADTR